MRPTLIPVTAVLGCAALACLGGCGQERDAGGEGDGAAAEATRVLELAVDPPEEGLLKVMNLAGELRVMPGEGDQVVLRATVHAGSPELAGKLRLEAVPGEEEAALLVRVAYPLDEHVVYRFGENATTGSMWLDLVGGGQWREGVDYAGRYVQVTNGKGAPVYADLEVRLPARSLTAAFDSKVGGMWAGNLNGDLSFTTGAWDIHLESISGTVAATSRSGDLKLRSISGSLSCATASGDIRIEDFRQGSIDCLTAGGLVVVDGAAGDLLEVTTASGDVLLERASMKRVELSTASGDMTSLLGGMEEFKAGSGSGHIEFTSESLGLRTVEAQSVGGGVQLLLNPGLAFQARAVAQREHFECSFPDAEPVIEEGQVVGCRRGEGGARIEISTGHGNVSLGPIR